MWLILSGRLRHWAIATFVLPLLGRGARRLGGRMEARGRSTRLSRGLLRAASLTGSHAPQPARRRGLLRGRRRSL